MNYTDKMSGDYFAIKYIAKICSKNTFANGREFRIVLLDNMKDFYENVLPCHKTTDHVTFFIEIESKHWVTLHIFKSQFAYYIDLWGNNLPLDLQTYFTNENIKVDFPVRFRVYDEHLICVYSLYYVKYFTEEFSGSAIELDEFNNKKKLQDFNNDTKETLKQINKVRNKVSVCFDLFSKAIDGKLPVISDYEHANLFLFFIDALALEDNAYKNTDLKDYIKESIIGLENCSQVKTLRCELLHREKRTVIYPQNFQAILFKEHNTKTTVENVFMFLKTIAEELDIKIDYKHSNIDSTSKIKGNELETMLLSGESMLQNFGNPFEVNDHSQILCDFSANFVKRIYSIQKNTYEYKMIFNFIVNFVPLLELLYKKKTKTFYSFINLRNQLVHNLYLLYLSNGEVAERCFKSLFIDLGRHFAIFSLSHNIIKYFKSYLAGKNFENLQEELRSFYDTFKVDFSKEIKLKNNNFHNILELKDSEFLIKQYLKTMPIIDSYNRVAIDLNRNKNCNLPSEVFVFSNAQRKRIFAELILIKDVHDSVQRSTEFEMLVDIIQNDLKLCTGLKEDEFEAMVKSIIKDEDQDDTLLKNVSHHVSTLSNHIKKPILMNVVLQEYMEIAAGNSIRHKRRHRIFCPLKKSSNSLFEIRIAEKFFSMDLKNIVKNILPILCRSPNENNLFPDTIQEVFDDKLFLKFLANDEDVTEIIKSNFRSTDFLAPLAINLLINNKLNLDENKTDEFINHYVLNILKNSSICEHLANFLEYKIKAGKKDFINKLCREIVANIKNFDINTLKPLFQIESFQDQVFNIVKPFLSRKSQETCDDYINHVKAATMLLNFKYMSARNSFQERDYEEALEVFNGKKGICHILKILTENGIIEADSNDVIKINFFLAETKIKCGLKSQSVTSESTNQFKGALKILETLKNKTKSQLPWNFNILEKMAYVHSQLKEFAVSKNMYFDLLKKLYFIKDEEHSGSAEIAANVTVIGKLFHSEGYKKAINKRPQHLNILNIWTMFAIQILNLGFVQEDINNKKKMFEQAFFHFMAVNSLQKDLLGNDHHMTRFTIIKQMEVTMLLCELQQKINTGDSILYGYFNERLP